VSTAGKSSLLHRLLHVERAIVTPISGTTRDTAEEPDRVTLGVDSRALFRPLAVQRRFDALVSKRQVEAITAEELEELVQLTEQCEQRDARRLRALAELAQLRQTTLSEVMGTLGITAPRYA
jgi:predicted GTPase